MFNIYLGIYIIVAILVIAGGTFSVVKSGQMIGSFLFFVGVLTIFIVFGIKWFSPGSVFSKTPVSWPPTINTCPDYLVHYGRLMPDGTKQDTCIDLIGVNRSNGALFPWSQDDSTSNPPSNPNKYFPFTYKAGMSQNQLKVLCDSAQQLGLTWEGITNGESCSYAPPPKVLGPDASGPSASCPSLTESVQMSLESQWNSMTATARGKTT